MQALVSDGKVWFTVRFSGRRESAPLLAKEKVKENEVFFAYFLFQKKVCAFSSVGRATDS